MLPLVSLATIAWAKLRDVMFVGERDQKWKGLSMCFITQAATKVSAGLGVDDEIHHTHFFFCKMKSEVRRQAKTHAAVV